MLAGLLQPIRRSRVTAIFHSQHLKLAPLAFQLDFCVEDRLVGGVAVGIEGELAVVEYAQQFHVRRFQFQPVCACGRCGNRQADFGTVAVVIAAAGKGDGR